MEVPVHWRRLGRRAARGALTAVQADLRSLALARMALAALLLVDLINRATYLEAHYADSGVMPRKALLELSWRTWSTSVHLLGGETMVQAALFVMAGIFALMLLLGYRTRLATILSWLLLLSLHNRNPLILNSGDGLLRMLLFWGIFMPWGARWSVDRSLAAGNDPGPDKVFSLGALAFFLQIFILYFFAGLLKGGQDWWVTRLAVYYTLSFEMMRLPLGAYIYPFPEFLKFITTATLWIELAGPFLFFIPFRNSFFRWVGVALFTAFQIGIALTLLVGMFAAIGIAGVMAFLPSETWKYLRLASLDRLFDATASMVRAARLWTGAKPYRKLSRLEGLVVVLLLGYVFAWNVTTLRSVKRPIPTNLKWVAYLLKLDQKWTMFAPTPPRVDGWFVIPGKLRNGQEVDLFRHVAVVSFDKPAYPAGEFGGARWRKYLRNIWTGRHRRHRAYYSRYLCRVWNRSHAYAEQLMSLEIIFVQEKTLPDYRVEAPKSVVLRRHNCFPKPKRKGKTGKAKAVEEPGLGDLESEL